MTIDEREQARMFGGIARVGNYAIYWGLVAGMLWGVSLAMGPR